MTSAIAFAASSVGNQHGTDYSRVAKGAMKSTVLRVTVARASAASVKLTTIGNDLVTTNADDERLTVPLVTNR
jgi:hypothetical protein